MIRALEVAGKVARHQSPVLLTGESGTGKELMARHIHRESDRADKPFVPVNCGAIPETLLESEFFGYVRGAFTGADRDKAGLFEAADGGTLFLDEVGELSTPVQVKLLRALQDGEIRRLGGTDTTTVNTRIVAATNRDLEAAVQAGDFRQDLYYRLAVIPIHLPPLRERTEAIPDLVHHLLERLRKRLRLSVANVSPGAMKALLAYPWPGNIRELENVLEQAMVLSESDTLDEESFSGRLQATDLRVEPGYASDDLSVKRRSAELESQLIRRALERTGGNRSKAAALLELSPRALRYKIKDYGLD
jgi:two-component system response regulator AtoC